ncbi:hypothetical protein LR48_Vigan10g142900 [Vigna angularis]|uniref:Uncharacterized protein n=1 Tax=Phaseolus angularis TaxID=3914 RepID=A0A0L9VKX3_PHAAN|nr:hypothetical protein LR48_Vigan10g142900 [Vigna angularis]
MDEVEEREEGEEGEEVEEVEMWKKCDGILLDLLSCIGTFENNELNFLKRELQNLIPLKVKLENPKGSPLATFPSRHPFSHFPNRIFHSATVYHTSPIFYFRVACVIRHAYVAATRACGSNATHHFSLHHPREQTITLAFVFLPVRLIQQPFSSQINHHNPHGSRVNLLLPLLPGSSARSSPDFTSSPDSAQAFNYHVVSELRFFRASKAKYLVSL